ncbi:hypothetical protein BGX23_001963 [Mortierella sp. AD031]|nr:hypothetical protein BGX23_001963 [Mortierella sp. AD031]
MLNSAVSDFSAKMSKHFHSNSVMPLSEANLSRHTLQSPASREAKLRHILVYVDLQRELIALAEEEEHGGKVHNRHHQHRAVKEKKSAILSTNELEDPSGEEVIVEGGATSRGLWHNSNNTQPKRSDLASLLHNSARHEQPHAPSPAPQLTHERQRPEQQQQQHQQQKHHQSSAISPTPIALRHQDSVAESLRQQRQHHQQQQERNTRQMDALDPSLALPRALPRSRMPGYRDSYNSAADLDAEWQMVDDVGPDSPTIPNSHYPVFEFAPGHNESRRALPIQASKSEERPIQYRRREGSAEDVEVQRQPLQRQTSFEKEKKVGRFGRFSLPGRSKRTSTSHLRKESLPEMSKAGRTQAAAEEDGAHARSYSLPNKDRVRFQEGAAAADVESTMNPSASMVKRRSKVRQLLNDIFKKTHKQQRHSQVISVPTAVRRAYPGSGHGILVSASIITPQDLPPRAGTSLSHYARESMVDPLQQELYQKPRSREQLVPDNSDSQQDDASNNNNNNDNAASQSPFLTTTSLTPPPPASVLRFSISQPANLDQIPSFPQGSVEVEEASTGEHKTRPSSNLMPIAGAIKDMTVASGNAVFGNSDPCTSQRRLVALTPEQPADLEGVGCQQNTFGLDTTNDAILPIATA